MCNVLVDQTLPPTEIFMLCPSGNAGGRVDVDMRVFVREHVLVQVLGL